MNVVLLMLLLMMIVIVAVIKMLIIIEDALRGRTTARTPLVNGHEFDSQPSCLASGDKHPWRTL